MIHITSLPQTSGALTIRPALRAVGGGLPVLLDTVLVVDDDATMRLALACMLADAQRQVVLARSAEDALERLPLINPDIILCDFLLDGKNGREFCQELKSAARWCHVPIIMVTRMDEPAIVADLLKSGADDVLTKPVHGEELRARVQSRLRSHARHLEPDQVTATLFLQD